MTPLQTKQLGKYIILDQLAVGGMAELFRAMITSVQGFEKLIAIKKILPHLASEEDLVNSFIDEAKLAALLHHQNIVQIYDFGSLEETYFIAMEYLFGKDCRAICKKAKEKQKPLDRANALLIVSRICAGLDYAHKLKDFQGKALNIIHRDISPQNILITYEGDIKIVDFGIAKAASQNTHTQMGMIKGKVAYMSPEQATGKAIDNRSDIFSCGIILYELITGERMFSGDTMHILSKIRDAEYVIPEESKKDLPEKLLRVFDRALQKKPEDRYQTCGEMLNDLEECMQDGTHPSPQGLAKYMKSLFAEEIAAEEQHLQKITKIGLMQGKQENSSKGSAGKNNKATKESTDSSSENKGRVQGIFKKPLIAVLASGFLLGTIVLLLLLNRGDDSQTDQIAENSASNNQSSVEIAPAPEPVEPKAKNQKTEKVAVSQIEEKQPESNPLVNEQAANESLKTTETIVEQAVDTPKSDGNIVSGIPGESTSEQQDGGQVPPATSDPTEVSEPATVEAPGTEIYQNAIEALVDNRFDEAIVFFEELLTLDPGMKDKIGAPYAESLLGKANRLQETDSEQALSLFKKSIQYDPNSEQAHFQLGMMLMNQKDYAAAIESYENVIQLNPEFPDTFFNLGFINALSKDYERAEEMYTRVVELHPDYLDEALFNLALVQKKLNKLDESRANLEKALEVNPENKLAQNYLKKFIGVAGE